MSQEKIEIKKESSKESPAQIYESTIARIESQKNGLLKEMQEEIEKTLSYENIIGKEKTDELVKALIKTREDFEVAVNETLEKLREEKEKLD